MTNTVLKSDFEIMIFRVDRLVGGFYVADIPAESVLNVIHAGLNIRAGALKNSFDRTIGQIADITAQVILAPNTMRGIAKAHPLHTSLKNNLLSNLLHNHYHKLNPVKLQ